VAQIISLWNCATLFGRAFLPIPAAVQPSNDTHRPGAGLDLKDALLVGGLVTACSIFGIYTAPPGVLAAFWATNAVLVGLLLRRAHPPRAAHWLFATASITLLFSMWTLLAIASGALVIGAPVDTPQAFMSLRVGVTLTALAPLAVASVMVARKELLARLQHAAAHDPLTQVLNRGGFMARADGTLAAQAQWPTAMLMMDIDFFKKVNDTYGHAAGDEVLTGFARLAAGCLRSGDVLGRLGGEEFAVLLPGCGVEDARAIAQRICDAFAAHPVMLADGVRFSATVSIGLGCWNGPGTPLGTMLSVADAALYRAKHDGRNRVVLDAAA
jgi:diguanylate cyclase (GGDEF)-like protein